MSPIRRCARLAYTAERSDGNDIRKIFGRLIYSIENLQIYVLDFLEFARLETTSVSINNKKIAMVDLFQKLDLQFENIALNQKIDLGFRYTSIELETDEKKLTRIIENLIANACKFARKRILVTCRRTSENITIAVYDDGYGISSIDSNKIFNPNYQGQGTDIKQQGVGLGLSITKRLATCLGYTVTFKTKIKCGTVFKVIIPKPM